MSSILSHWKPLTVAWLALTACILLIDVIGVRLINQNGLVFKVLIYWNGLGYFFAAGVFALTILTVNEWRFSICNAISCLVLAGIWCFFAFLFLMMGFHGFIGGWY